MPMILVMHSVDELRSALADANEYLAIQRGTKRRQSGEGNQEEDRVLGVWLREDVDAGLPRMSCHDLVSWKAESIAGGQRRPTPVDTMSGLRSASRRLFPAFGRSAGSMAPSFMARQVLYNAYAMLSMAS